MIFSTMSSGMAVKGNPEPFPRRPQACNAALLVLRDTCCGPDIMMMAFGVSGNKDKIGMVWTARTITRSRHRRMRRLRACRPRFVSLAHAQRQYFRRTAWGDALRRGIIGKGSPAASPACRNSAAGRDGSLKRRLTTEPTNKMAKATDKLKTDNITSIVTVHDVMCAGGGRGGNPPRNWA